MPLCYMVKLLTGWDPGIFPTYLPSGRLDAGRLSPTYLP